MMSNKSHGKDWSDGFVSRSSIVSSFGRALVGEDSPSEAKDIPEPLLAGTFSRCMSRRRLLPVQPKGWRLRKKTHASSPSTSGKTNEKTSVIQTRR